MKFFKVFTQQQHFLYFDSLYNAIVSRDILNRERIRERNAITDPNLLDKLAQFASDNIGNLYSPNKVANTLVSAGNKTTNKTVDSYLQALDDAFILYRIPRFDVHGKQLLTTNPKRYIVDTGFHTYLNGYRTSDIGRVFENSVFLQLKYEGWQIHVGKIYSLEVDFIALKDGKTKYIQVTDNLYSEETRRRELTPLQKIKDAYEKVVVVRQGTYDSDIDGIQIISAQNFFLPPGT